MTKTYPINAKKVRELFASLNLTDWDVVRETGLGITTVQKIQRDGARVSKYTFRVLRLHFNMSIGEFLLNEEG